MQALIEIKNARVFRGEHRVFDQLNLSFFPGNNTAILGPNGAGKSTLFRMLTREISPVVKPGTHLRFFGEKQVNIWELRKKIGFVSQEYQNHYSALATGEEVVLSAFFGSVGIHRHHAVQANHLERAQEILKTMNIQELARRQFLQLSFGQQRRLLLARALVHNPEILIFDEPTNGLDIGSSIQLTQEIRRQCQRGKTVILMTHHLQELVPEIDRVIMLKAGKVFKDGDKETLVNEQNLSSLFDVELKLQLDNGYYSASGKPKALL